ncbi:glycosyltransferase family 9 protein [Pseudonocardia sp. H11422]|uniref:glycosyltransferase family 9 protein n=1 Tax=Pseudonocardia sp. H11422 TaxID=2835866 RepID=UPI001BDD6AD2|nr:glycosyltransferase family 9 protein [Pseudonocardia sp. H11422]
MQRPGSSAVLALRALHLGDLLVAVPALRALRRAHPGYRMVLAAPRSLDPVAGLTGAVDELLPTPSPADLRWSRPVQPTVAVNLHGYGPDGHRALDTAVTPRRRIGFRAPGWDGPEWAAVAARCAHERERWCALLEEYGIPTDPEDLVLDPPPRLGRMSVRPMLVHPGARRCAKRWPVERFAEVVAALDHEGHAVAVIGSAVERPLALAVAEAAGLPERQVLAGRTGLRQLCALVAGAGLVISGDTGTAHLASAFRTPSVVLFGPVDPAQWGPPASGPHVVLTDPGARRGDLFADDPDPALLAVQVADVLSAVSRVCPVLRPV